MFIVVIALIVTDVVVIECFYIITDQLCFQKVDRKCSRDRCAAADVDAAADADAPGGRSAPLRVEAASGLCRGASLRCGTTAAEPESVNPPGTPTEPGGEHDRGSATGVRGDKDRP